MTRRFEVTAEADLAGDATLTLEDHGVVVDGAEPVVATWVPNLFTSSFRVATTRTVAYSSIERDSIQMRRNAAHWLALLVLAPMMGTAIFVSLGGLVQTLMRPGADGSFGWLLAAVFGAAGLWWSVRATRAAHLTLRYRVPGGAVRGLRFQLRSPARLAALHQALVAAVDTAARYTARTR